VLADDHPFRHSLLVRAGQLVLYDYRAEPIVAIGQDVVGALLLPNAGELLLTDSSGGVAAVPIEDGDAKTVWLSDDGCDLVDAGPTGSVAAFYSPCAARRLVLYRPAQDGDPAEAVALATDANAPRIVTRSLALQSGVERVAMSAVFFRELESDRGALWAQAADEPPYRLLDEALDSWMLAAFDERKAERPVVAFALVPRPGEDAVDLVATDAAQRVTVARRVRSLYESRHSLVLVAEGDTASVDLIVLESKPFADVELREPELLLSNALAGLEIERTLVLPNVVDMAPIRLEQDGEWLSLVRSGPASDDALFLVRQSLLDGSFQTPKAVTEGAGEQYSFSHNVPGTLLALVRSGRNAFRLEQLWPEQDLHNTIGRNVTSYYESVVEGRLGVVYATAGDDPGLYYSSLR
jgi:hypothetical protein